MKTIRRFWNPAEAGFARSLLESVGIPATLADEHAFTLGQQLAPWGIRLQVPEGDEARALDILDRQEEFAPLPDNFEPPAIPAEKEALPTGPGSRFATFCKGGIWALALLGGLAILVLVLGGRVYATFPGLLVFFAVGGLVALGLRAIYDKGGRDALTRGGE